VTYNFATGAPRKLSEDERAWLATYPQEASTAPS
jgi:hypothetical protein